MNEEIRVELPSGMEGPRTRWQSAAAHYAELGWSPTAMDKLVWIKTGRVLEALDMPHHLGTKVLRYLQENGFHAAVFDASESPRRDRWIFLTACHGTLDRDTQAMLRTLDVFHLWAGATLDLPPSTYDTPTGTYQLNWVTPTHTTFPTVTAVIQAMKHAAEDV